MSLTTEQKADLLFKKIATDKATSTLSTDWFGEAVNSRKAVFPSDVWNQASSIPNTAPGATSGVVEKITDLQLTHYGGSLSTAFYDPTLTDIIPFNYGDGSSYFYTLKTDADAPIPFGTNDWFLDPESGVLTFFNGFPTGVDENTPPKISCFKYVGSKGLNVSGVTSGLLEVKENVRLATTGDLSATYNASGGSNSTGNFTGVSTSIDGVSLVVGNRILVKDQSDAKQNGIYEVTAVAASATMERASDFDDSTSAEVVGGAYTFVSTGTTNASSGWILQGDTITLNTDDLNWLKFTEGSGNTYIMSKDDKNMTALAATGDEVLASNDTISNTPVNGSYISLFVNGKEYEIGDGLKTKDAYISGDGGSTARYFDSADGASVQSGDRIYWNSSVAGSQLDAGWRIALHYLVAS
jgi:hypothetical protein